MKCPLTIAGDNSFASLFSKYFIDSSTDIPNFARDSASMCSFGLFTRTHHQEVSSYILCELAFVFKRTKKQLNKEQIDAGYARSVPASSTA